MSVLLMPMLVLPASLIVFFLQTDVLSMQSLVLPETMILFSFYSLVLPPAFIKIPGRILAMKKNLIVSPGPQQFIYTLLRNANALIR